MRTKQITSSFLGVLLLIGVFSCSIATEKINLETGNQTLEFQDIFEGDNTASIKFSMNDFLAKNPKVSSKNLKDVLVSGVTVSKSDLLGLSQIKGVKFSIMSDDLPTIAVAVKNNMEVSEELVELEVLSGIEIAEYLERDVLYFILDVDYKTNVDESQKIDVNLKLEANIEKQE